MQRLSFSTICLSLLAWFPQPAWSGEDVEETKAKLQAVQKQIEDLRQREQTLLKKLEMAKKRRQSARNHTSKRK